VSSNYFKLTFFGKAQFFCFDEHDLKSATNAYSETLAASHDIVRTHPGVQGRIRISMYRQPLVKGPWSDLTRVGEVREHFAGLGIS